MVIILQLSLAFAMGSFFRLLANYRQSEIIRNQKHVLEQYVSQVERITLLEERDRLSKTYTIRWDIPILQLLWGWKHCVWV